MKRLLLPALLLVSFFAFSTSHAELSDDDRELCNWVGETALSMAELRNTGVTKEEMGTSIKIFTSDFDEVDDVWYSIIYGTIYAFPRKTPREEANAIFENCISQFSN